MCLLCSDLSGDVHWAETAPRDGRADVAAEADRRRARSRRIRLVNRVLATAAAVHEDLSATRYVLDNRKGVQDVVRDLGELWKAAEALAGQRLDPLDDSLLERLEADRYR